MIRDKLNVENLTYYESSYVEQGSMKIIYNSTARGDIESPYFSYHQLISNNACTSDVIVEEKDVMVYNKAKQLYADEQLINPEFYITNKFSDINFNENIDYTNMMIKNSLLSNEYIFILQKNENSYLNPEVVNTYVLDKNLEIEYNIDVVDLPFIENKTIVVSNINNKSNMLYVNDLNHLNEKYEKFDNMQLLVSKRKEESLNFNIQNSSIVKFENIKDSGWENQMAIEIGVSNINKDDDNNNGTTGTTIGSDLKNLSFIVQQMSFFEFNFVFKNKTIEDIFNLPTGLFFDIDRQRIIGTPMKSGKYTFAILFDDLSILNGFIDVPPINREL